MPPPWSSTWKTRLTKRRHSFATDAGNDASMDLIREGSHERSAGSSSSSHGQSTLQVQEELEQLRREIELLKATQTRTDDSPRSLQVREQMEQLRLENERLRRWAPPDSLTYQHDNSVGAQQRSEYGPSHLAYRNDQYQFPDGMSPRGVQSGEDSTGSKYVIEAPFAFSSSKTSRSQSLPRPSAPSGASSARSLVHSQSIQVVTEGHNPWLENGGGTPSSSGLASVEQRKSMSPQTLQAFGSLHILRQEKERLMADRELSTRTGGNNPFSTGPDVSVRTLQVLDEVANLKRDIEMLKSNRVETPAMSERTLQVAHQLDKVRHENEMLKVNKAKEMEHAKRRLAYFEQNHAAASQVRMQEIKKVIITSQELDLAFLVDATGSMQVPS